MALLSNIYTYVKPSQFLGNLHLNITCKEYSQEVMDMIEPYVYDWTRGRDGSISAEHGLG